MKTLIVVRHAKAEPGGFIDDYKRGLENSGKDDAKRIASHLKRRGYTPKRWIASSAKRAWQTAGIFLKEFELDVKTLEPWNEFYEGVSTHDFLEKLADTNEAIDCVIVFGHNPTVHYLLANLCTNFNRDTPTCATAVVQFNVESWNELSAREGKFVEHITTKSIM